MACKKKKKVLKYFLKTVLKFYQDLKKYSFINIVYINKNIKLVINIFILWDIFWFQNIFYNQKHAHYRKDILYLTWHGHLKWINPN